MKPEQATRYRTECDPLGEKRVPDDVLYGVQTLRALENFLISNLRVEHIKPHPEKMREYAERFVGVAALYNEERGFMGAAELAKKAIDTGKSAKQVVAEE